MAEITGLTAERMLAIEAASVVDGSVVGDELILTTRDGTIIDAGNVRGPKGDVGPASIALMAWPVGSLFMSVVPTDPATLLGGGTWAPWGTGRVPVAVDTSQTEFATVELTGGEKTHKLTTPELPAHTHTINHDHPVVTTSSDTHSHTIGTGGSVDTVATNNDVVRAQGGALGPATTSSDTHTHTVDVPAYSGDSGSAGANAPHNNLQPYITCYMWKRTA